MGTFLRRLGLVTAAAAMAAGIATPAGATPGHTFYVAPGGTGDCTTGQSAAHPLNTIAKAIACAATVATHTTTDTISLAPATYYEHSLRINSNLYFPGHGATIDGQNASIIFLVDNATVLLQNMILQHGNGNSGGAIFNRYGNVTLRNSIVQDSHARFYGGAVFNNAAMTIAGSILRRNSAVDGGAVVNHGLLTITGSVLANNNAGSYGGGLFNGGTLKIRGTSIHDNSARVNGGGIYTSTHAVDLDTSSVVGNTPNNCAPANWVPNCVH